MQLRKATSVDQVLFSKIGQNSPVIYLNESLLEGSINVDTAYVEVVKSSFISLDLMVTDSYFIANQFMESDENDYQLTINAENSSCAINQLKGSTEFSCK